MKDIVANYQNSIKNIIKTFTGQYNEDIEQEVYIKTWKGLKTYDNKGKFKSWVSKITANVCRDYFKSSDFKQSNLVRIDDEKINLLKDPKENIESRFITKQRQKTIIKAVDSLKPKLREVIVLYEMKGLDYDEISKIIKCPVGTVKSRLYNARKELSVALKDLM